MNEYLNKKLEEALNNPAVSRKRITLDDTPGFGGYEPSHASDFNYDDDQFRVRDPVTSTTVRPSENNGRRPILMGSESFTNGLDQDFFQDDEHLQSARRDKRVSNNTKKNEFSNFAM